MIDVDRVRKARKRNGQFLFFKQREVEAYSQGGRVLLGVQCLRGKKKARGPADDCRRSKASMLGCARATSWWCETNLRRFYYVGVRLSGG